MDFFRWVGGLSLAWTRCCFFTVLNFRTIGQVCLRVRPVLCVAVVAAGVRLLRFHAILAMWSCMPHTTVMARHASSSRRAPCVSVRDYFSSARWSTSSLAAAVPCEERCSSHQSFVAAAVCISSPCVVAPPSTACVHRLCSAAVMYGRGGGAASQRPREGA